MKQDTEETDLRICPIIFGERHNPSERASVTNITNRNTTLGSVFYALCQGVISNLHSMMSQHHLLAAGIKRIVCSGRAAIKNPLIQDQIRSHYKMPIELCQADAAVGAAHAILNANPPAWSQEALVSFQAHYQLTSWVGWQHPACAKLGHDSKQ